MAIASTKDKFVVAALADEMRRRFIVIPGITVLERLAGQACTEAGETLFADIAGRLPPDIPTLWLTNGGSGNKASTDTGNQWGNVSFLPSLTTRVQELYFGWLCIKPANKKKRSNNKGS